MMKQILLRVTTVSAEIIGSKLSKFFCCDFAFARKIRSPQHSLDPDIDWKSVNPFVGKKHDAIRNLEADPRQFAQASPQLFICERAPLFEIHFSGSDTFCGFQKIRCSISQRALSQLGFSCRD